MSMGMSMGFSLRAEPRLLLGLGCKVCGHVLDMPEDAATQEKVEDIAARCSSNPDLHRRMACPKCGYEMTSTWFIVRTKNGNLRSTENPSTKSVKLGGPYCKWELKERKKCFGTVAP
jgi:hypothetical protein